MKHVRAQSTDKTPAFCKAVWKTCMSHQTNLSAGGGGRAGRYTLPAALNVIPKSRGCYVHHFIVLWKSRYLFLLKTLLFMDAKIPSLRQHKYSYSVHFI